MKPPPPFILVCAQSLSLAQVSVDPSCQASLASCTLS